MKQVYDLRLWLKYLGELGLIKQSQRGSHSKYDYPPERKGGQLPRPVIVREEYKEVPIHHIHTTLLSMGKAKSHFEKWVNAQSKGKRKKGAPKK